MARRAVAIALAVVALAGCAPPDDAPPAASPSAVPAESDAALVRAALRATRERATGTYVIEIATDLGGGKESTQRTEGRYDLAAVRLALTSSQPDEITGPLASLLGNEGLARDGLVQYAVVTASDRYLRMAGWTGAAKDRWLRYDSSDAELRDHYFRDVPTEVFPAEVDMLASAGVSARDGTGRNRVPPVLHVTVPAPLMLDGLSTEGPDGLYVGDVKATVEVEVVVADGVLRSVRYDQMAALDAALAEKGVDNPAAGGPDITATVTLSGLGAPVRVDVPGPGDLVTLAELRAATPRDPG